MHEEAAARTSKSIRKINHSLEVKFQMKIELQRQDHPQGEEDSSSFRLNGKEEAMTYIVKSSPSKCKNC